MTAPVDLDPIPLTVGVGPHQLVTLPACGPGFATYSHREKRFGHPAAVSALMRVAAQWHRRYPDRPPLMFGNISPVDGTHSGHRTPGFEGLQVDMRPVGGGRYTGPLTWQQRGRYSQRRTQDLVRLLHLQSGLKIRNVLFNDPCLRGVWPYPGHDDHLHIAFQRPGRTGTLDLAPTLGTLHTRVAVGLWVRHPLTGADLVWGARFLAGSARGREQREQERLLWTALRQWADLPNLNRPCPARYLQGLRGTAPAAGIRWGALPTRSRAAALRVMRGSVPAGAGSGRTPLEIVRGRGGAW